MTIAGPPGTRGRRQRGESAVGSSPSAPHKISSGRRRGIVVGYLLKTDV